MRRVIPVLAALTVAACGYAPARSADAALPAYRTDLAACRTAATDSVDQRNAKRGLTWAAGSITRWTPIADATSACMAEKGWGRTRTCTADELRQGNRTEGLIVAASGVRCTDPATRTP